MTVRMSIFRKKPELSQEQFQQYWRDIHAPIAVTIPALQRYEQNCTVERYLPDDDELRQPVDGICKLHFTDASAMQGVMSPEMTRVLMEDEAQFIEGLRTFVVRPSETMPVTAKAATKCISLVTRRHGLDPATFEKGWSGEFASWVAAQPGVAGYTQNFVTARTADRRPASYDQSPVDCVDEIWLTPPAGSEETRDLLRAIQTKAQAHADALNISVVTVNVPPIPREAGAPNRSMS